MKKEFYHISVAKFSKEGVISFTFTVPTFYSMIEIVERYSVRGWSVATGKW